MEDKKRPDDYLDGALAEENLEDSRPAENGDEPPCAPDDPKTEVPGGTPAQPCQD